MSCGNVVWATLLPSAIHQIHAWENVWCSHKKQVIDAQKLACLWKKRVGMQSAQAWCEPTKPLASRWDTMAQIDSDCMQIVWQVH